METLIIGVVCFLAGAVVSYFIVRNNPKFLKFEPEQMVDRLKLKHDEWSKEAADAYEKFNWEYNKAKSQSKAYVEKYVKEIKAKAKI